MTLRHIQIFRALCENDCNTTRTAASLNMTQPAVSLAIKELEQQYGVALFDRIGRRLSLSQAGERFLAYAKTIETAFSDMETEMKSWDKQGIIRVGSTLTIGSRFLPLYAKEFTNQYPNIRIKGFCGPASIVERKIIDNELDIAFSEGVASDPHIVSEAYMDDSLVVIAPPDMGYTAGQKISLEEFKKLNFVLRESGSGTRKVFDTACEKLGFRVNPVWESMCNMAIIVAVSNGIGVGALSYRIAETAINKGTVVPIEVEGLNLDRKFYIIHHREKNLSTAVQTFIDTCKSKEFELPEIYRK